jgi:hypothetical protein
MNPLAIQEILAFIKKRPIVSVVISAIVTVGGYFSSGAMANRGLDTRVSIVEHDVRGQQSQLDRLDSKTDRIESKIDKILLRVR